MKDIWSKLDTSESKNAIKLDKKPFGSFKPNFLQKILITIGQKTFLKRGLFRSHYAKIIMSLSFGPLDIEFRGCAYRLWNEKNLIEYGLLLDPMYNNEDIDFLIHDAKNNSNFIDIGSNIGLYSQPLALAAPRGKTVSIDANPLMKHRLGFNKKSSSISNIEMINMAVSDTKGSGALKIRKDDIAIVALDESSPGNIKYATLIEILDMNNINKIYGLKIDIEGHEDKALVPFLMNAPKKLLPQKIVIEQPTRNQDYPGCLNAFKELDYKLVGRSKNNSFYELNAHDKK
ncbi:FkbM family methyltransferase [Amylibacter sp.]|jgi:FkbM family methyltransferase|nr:FkbM family methyltransferase [Amylibacter sp.]MDC1488674.1 FkbM family methyltransferase [bacterium]MDC1531966.1 FkbM family methyltransferase [Amylibacter sp.]